MTALWVVTALMSIVVATLGVIVAALVRQVGILHVRLSPVRALHRDDDIQPGDILHIEDPQWESVRSNGKRRIVVAFVSPTCSVCKPLIPVFNATARTELSSDEALVLVADVRPSRAAEYARSNRIFPPVLGVEGCMERNRIPGAPYVVVTDAGARVLAAGVINSGEQLNAVIDKSRYLPDPRLSIVDMAVAEPAATS